MGKKSRAKVKAMANGSAPVSAAAAAAAAAACCDGGGNGGSGGIDSRQNKTKKIRCISCLSNIKDVNKAFDCPGCSRPFCWRCERKYFESCPNGAVCVRPMRRCRDCVSGKTTTKLIAEGRSAGDSGAELVGTGRPFVTCGRDGCYNHECYHCCMDSSTVMSIINCFQCNKKRCPGCAADAYDFCVGAMNKVEASVGERNFSCRDVDETLRVMNLGTRGDDWMTKCRNFSDCGKAICMKCVFIRCTSEGTSLRQIKICDYCYYSKKPCANPHCPYEVGVPTKRCGDCRSTRYCSKACQVAMYPSHQKECKSIQEKKARKVGRSLLPLTAERRQTAGDF